MKLTQTFTLAVALCAAFIPAHGSAEVNPIVRSLSGSGGDVAQRAIGRLVQTFEDEDGDLSSFSCTATLIGRKHIITEGTCIIGPEDENGATTIAPDLYFTMDFDEDREIPFSVHRPLNVVFPEGLLKVDQDGFIDPKSNIAVLELDSGIFSYQDAGRTTGGWFPGVEAGFEANAIFSHSGEDDGYERELREGCDIFPLEGEPGLFGTDCIDSTGGYLTYGAVVATHDDGGSIGPIQGVVGGSDGAGKFFGVSISKTAEAVINHLLEGYRAFTIEKLEAAQSDEKWTYHEFSGELPKAVFVRNTCLDVMPYVVASELFLKEGDPVASQDNLAGGEGRFFLRTKEEVVLLSIPAGSDDEPFLKDADLKRDIDGETFTFQAFDISDRSDAGFTIDCDGVVLE